MKLFNTLSKTLEEFNPITEGKVGVYSCGPTVYSNLHIGNLSAFIYADVLRRSLTAQGYDVQHVLNITDVDDKTIRDSKLAFPDNEPMMALKKLTDKYEKVFKDDLEATGNNIAALTFISAVDTIPEMIALTQKLLDNKIAYIADDAVYFSITKYYQAGHTYGKLQKIATQQSKARIANDEYDKDSASDFALWKRSEPGEPSWDATFSEDNMKTEMPGRPGWHIECSAMSEKTLGLPFDIHTGGIDLKFPHHENEIAQSVGAGAEKLANYFVHNNHLLINGKKMSKSLGNIYTLRDIENKGFSAQAFRLLVLESHYHNESNFSWDILSAANNRLQNWQAAADTRWQLDESPEDITDTLKEALADNMNTPRAIKEIDTYFDALEGARLAPHANTVQSIQDMLGIDLLKPDIAEDVKQLIEKRRKARDEKDWAIADTLRDQITAAGYGLRDIKDREIWFRV